MAEDSPPDLGTNTAAFAASRPGDMRSAGVNGEALSSLRAGPRPRQQRTSATRAGSIHRQLSGSATLRAGEQTDVDELTAQRSQTARTALLPRPREPRAASTSTQRALQSRARVSEWRASRPRRATREGEQGRARDDFRSGVEADRDAMHCCRQ